MPEGDTVWRTAHRLDQALSGEPLSRCDLRWASVATVDLSGAVTAEVVARGKHILHRLDTGVTVHSHLRMEGQWRVEATDRLRPASLHNPHLRAVLGTNRWTALGLRLGMLHVIRTEREADLVGHLGPDLLGPDWDVDRAVHNLAADPRSLGAALLDQRNLAGVGTFWAAESLFRHRLPPWTPAATADPATLALLVDWLQVTMDASRRHAMQSSTGERVRGRTSWVHGRSGRPCRRCGSTVRVAPIGEPPTERTMFYCPTCQGGLSPTDDGRHQAPLGARQTRSEWDR